MPALGLRVTSRGRATRAPLSERAAEADLVEFVRAHHPRLIRLAGLICREVADAEDAVQAALERAWRGLGGLDRPDRLSAWLDRIVVHEAIRLERRRRPWLTRLLGDDVADRAWAGSRVDIASQAAARTTVQDAFARLPVAQRGVVTLHLYLGYSMAETAGMLGVPLETARSRLRLARARLRAELGEDEP